MVASYQTINKVVQIIRKHVDDATFGKIIDELKDVDGNTSFRDTIQRLVEKVNKS